MAMSSLAYLEQVLCPQLIPGQVVIVDKLVAHKVAGVKALMERLSPSPLLHPILRTSIHRASLVQIKQLLHAAKARSLEALELATVEASAAVPAENAAAWFEHCDYGPH